MVDKHYTFLVKHMFSFTCINEYLNLIYCFYAQYFFPYWDKKYAKLAKELTKVIFRGNSSKHDVQVAHHHVNFVAYRPVRLCELKLVRLIE